MKKIFSLFVMALVSASMLAASITAADVNFGEVSIKGQTLPVTGSQTVTVNFSGLATDGYYMYAEISEGLLDDYTNPNGFYVSPATQYLGYGVGAGSMDFTVSYSVKEAGTFTGKLHLSCYDTNYEEVDGYANITITVIGDAVVAKTTPFERIETTSGLHDGDTIVFVCESAKEVCGPLDGAALTSIEAKIENGQADVPETAQMFRAKSYSGGWQFYTADAEAKRLHLDIVSNNAKGAFTYADAQAGQILATWGVSITSGVAEVTRNDEEGTYPVRWVTGSSGNRFKPYKNFTGSDIAIYKKAGAAEEVQSKLEVESIDLGEVEMQDTAVAVVNYTAEHLSDLDWDITGADKDLFRLTATGDATSGQLKIEYKRNATKTGAVNAKVYALYTNAQLDLAEAYFDIHLTLKANTILLTGLAFDGAPTTIDQHQTIDMSQYLVFTPNDAADKSVTWATDHDYQGTIDADGKLYAKQVTGTVTVTATSVRVPSVSASHTLTITVPTITDFTLSDSEITLLVGGKDTLSATAFVPDYASATPTFASSDATIAAVNKNGIITAKALGDAEITATIGEVSKTCTVHVVATPVDTIYFAEKEARLNLGSTLQLAPTVLPAQAAADHTVAYASGNEAVATVSETGLVTSVAEGDAVITATANGKSAQITIHVVAPLWFEKVTDATMLGAKDTIILAGSILLADVQTAVAAGDVITDKNALTLLTSNLAVGDDKAYADDALVFVIGGSSDSYTLTKLGTTKTLASSDGTKLSFDNKKNTWKFVADGDKGVMIQSVDFSKEICYNSQSGYIRVYAHGNNSTPLYAYVRKYIAPEAESVSLSKDSLRMHIGDQNVKLKVTVAPAEAEQAVSWSSTDETVATVDASGWVHAVAEGEAKIVVKVQSNELLTDTCVVLISEWRVESIELDVAEDTLTVGETLRINATVEPTGHHFDVDFYSSDTTVATVTIGGLVTAVAPGDAIITAKSGDVEATAKIHVEAVPVPVEMGEISIADFLAAKDTFNIYTLTGVVSNIKMDEDSILYNDYGNFDLTDSTGTIYIYGLLTAEGVAKQFNLMGIDANDTLTLKGSYAEYKGKAEIENAIFVEVKKYVEPVITVDSIWLNVAEDSVEVGKTLQLTAIITPEGHEFEVVWSSSDETIATVSAEGLVTGLAVGDVVITATSGEKEAKATIHVWKEEDQAIEDVDAETKAYKMLREGRVIVIRNGVVYTIEGRKIEN